MIFMALPEKKLLQCISFKYTWNEFSHFDKLINALYQKHRIFLWPNFKYSSATKKILIQFLRFHLKKKEYYVKNMYKTGIGIFCLGLYFFQILCKKTFHFSWKLPVLGITFVLTDLWSFSKIYLSIRSCQNYFLRPWSKTE